MKAIAISQKVHLVRHWGKWYIVQRGAKDWERLGSIKNRKRTRPFDLDKAAKSLAERT